MLVEAIPLTNFVHGHINAIEQRPVWIEESTARDLERAGLVRIRTAHAIPARQVDEVKPADDGQGQLSSALQAAPASPMTTSSTLESGKRRAKGAKDAPSS